MSVSMMFPPTACRLLAGWTHANEFAVLQVASLRSLGKILVLSEPLSRRHAAFVAQLLTSPSDHQVLVHYTRISLRITNLTPLVCLQLFTWRGRMKHTLSPGVVRQTVHTCSSASPCLIMSFRDVQIKYWCAVSLQFVRVEAVGIAALLVETFPNSHEPLLEALGGQLATSYIPSSGLATGKIHTALGSPAAAQQA